MFKYIPILDDPINPGEVMEDIKISRGNASMNIRALIDWGIVFKEYKSGERREFFTAEKDLDKLAVTIAKERSKREIKPALRILKEVSSIETNDSKSQKHFINQTSKLYDFVLKTDNMLDKITQYNENWLSKLIIKVIK